LTTETELVAVQQCEFAALMAAENLGMIWSWFVDSCSNESTAIGALIAVVGVLIGFYRAFVKLNPESEKYKRKLEYYLNTHHPSDFDNVAVLSPEEKKAKRDAIALQKEIETYRSRNRIRIYELWLNRVFNKLRRFFGEKPILRNPSQSKSNFQQAGSLFSQLLSVGSYKFCLTLAFVYPLLFALINGLVSNEVALAPFPLFKFDNNAYKVIFVVGIALGFVLFWLDYKLQDRGRRWRLIAALCSLGARAGAVVAFAIFAGALSDTFAGASSTDFFVAFALALALVKTFIVAFAGAVSFAGTITGAVAFVGSFTGLVSFAVAFFGAFAVTFAGALSGTFAGALSGTFAVYGAFAFAFAAAFAAAFTILNHLQKNEHLSALKHQGYLLLVALLYLAACCLLIVKFGLPSKLAAILVPLMLGILPLLNAPIDWLSLNFTRALSYLIADHHGKKRFLLGFLLADIAGAVLFMALIIAVMLGVLSVANSASYFFAAKPILDFNQIMPAMINADTASQYIWAHFMVLSTLIPTLLHLILVIVSVVLYPFGHAKKAMYDNFYQNQQHYAPIVMRHQQTQKAQAMVLGAVVLIIAAVAIMNFSWAGCGLWHYADWVLGMIDNGYQSPAGGDLLCF